MVLFWQENRNLKNQIVTTFCQIFTIIQTSFQIRDAFTDLHLTCSKHNLITFQDKVYKEIVQVIGDDPSKPITVQDINKMPYLKAFVKETFRSQFYIQLVYTPCQNPEFINRTK